MMRDKVQKNLVERLYVQEDERSRVEVKVSYKRVRTISHETFEVDIPGDGPRVVGRNSQDLVSVENENVMVAISIGIADHVQTLVLPAREFKTMVSAVMKALPRGPGAGYVPPPFDDDEDA